MDPATHQATPWPLLARPDTPPLFEASFFLDATDRSFVPPSSRNTVPSCRLCSELRNIVYNTCFQHLFGSIANYNIVSCPDRAPSFIMAWHLLSARDVDNNNDSAQKLLDLLKDPFSSEVS